MLATLEQSSVRGGKWQSLIDKVYKPDNLYSAFREVAAHKGAPSVDKITIEDFTAALDRNVTKLEQQLRAGTYTPQSIKRVHIPKLGTNETRPLAPLWMNTGQRCEIGSCRTHFAMCWNRYLNGSSRNTATAFVPIGDAKTHLRRVDRLIKALRKHVADNSVIGLVEKFLQAQVLDGMDHWTPVAGAPQGAIISPLLSNLNLNELDHQMAAVGYEMTRYADDFVIQCRTAEEAAAALEMVREWTTERGLTLHPTKTKIVHVDIDGFEFLGYRFLKHRLFPRQKSLAKFRETLRSKTKRTNGNSLQAIIVTVNRTLRGWYEYFKHSGRTTFPALL